MSVKLCAVSGSGKRGVQYGLNNDQRKIRKENTVDTEKDKPDITIVHNDVVVVPKEVILESFLVRKIVRCQWETSRNAERFPGNARQYGCGSIRIPLKQILI